MSIVKGLVRQRIDSAINLSLSTGKIEVLVTEFTTLNESAPCHLCWITEKMPKRI